MANVSLAGLDPLIITGSTETEHLSDAAFTYLDLATTTAQGPFIDEFSRRTLELLGYAEHGLALLTQYNIPLVICGNERSSQTDVYLVDGRSMMLLILQKDKTIFNSSNPEPQVIADAIAAYQYNNNKRERRGLSRLDNMALNDAVITGQHPSVQTQVQKCVTIIGYHHSFREGMEKPEYRLIAFRHFIAFKSLGWEKFLVKYYYPTLFSFSEGLSQGATVKLRRLPLTTSIETDRRL
ncbi:hypothetical protein AX17_003232 [Amanita inopinata Kibby_2008]|nr:hypothetical protein AX17_003232 [Amanita inopinata Kibby_2008]